MLKLSIQDIEGRTTYVPLKDGEYSIGRDEANTICLTDRNVSRQHARVTAKGGTVWIESVAATYGTRYNNLLLKEKAELFPGDVVEIGDYKVELVSGEKRDNAVRDVATSAAPAKDPAAKSAPQPQASKGKAPDGATAIVNLADISSLLNKDPAGASTPIPEASQPRLIVESENLRGLELRITKTPISIGRMRDPSDLVIDHRSISKEHARLTRLNDGTWQVLDMGSANGIKVNGEPYSKSEIRSGDRLELGHVAMRFLAAGAKAPSVAPAQGGGGGAKGKTGLIVGGVVAVLLIAVVAAVLLIGGKKDEAAKDDKSAQSGKASGDKSVDESASKKGSGDDKAAEDKAAEDKGADEKSPDEKTPGEKAADGKAAGKAAAAQGDSEEKAAPKLDGVDEILADVDAKIAEGKYEEAKPMIEVGKLKHPGSAPIAAKMAEVDKLVDLVKRLRQAENKLDSDPAEAIVMATDVRGKAQAGTPLHEGAGSVIEMAKKKLSGKAVKVAKPAEAKPAEIKKVEEKPKEEPKAAEGVKSPKELYDEARESLGSSEYDKAIASAKQALKGGMVKANNVLAKAYYGKGDKGGCLKYATAADKAGVADAVVSGLLEKCQ